MLSLGTLTLAADRLSAIFLFVTGLVFLPVSIFSGAYLTKYAASYSLRYFSILYHGLFASIVLVLVADDAISFLIAWETMSIVGYLLVNFEYEHQESSHAGFVMLAMSEAGTIAVVIAFVLIAGAAGALEFDKLRSAAPLLTGEVSWAVFLLSFFGFAVKAGLVPLNSWLPLAHPVAPTNVSALLSSVIVNLGIYGIMRLNLDLAPVKGSLPGLIVLGVGSVSALIGILYATVQAEMKRLLAHSTIENMGIVAAGIGAAMTFLATGHPVVGAIALIAALYHLANHSVYKALLFVGTGAVECWSGNPRSRPSRRHRSSHALDERILSGRRLVDIGASAAQRLRQRMADASDDSSFSSACVDADQDRVCDLGRALGPYRRPRGHLLRQGLRHGLSRHAAVGRRSSRRRGP